MRASTRLFARFLEPGAPTGLAGLNTHPAPRSTLIYLYSSTLSKLQQIPSHSPYRQATEAMTRKRLATIEATVPEGYDAWSQRVQKAIQQHRSSPSKALEEDPNAPDDKSRHSPAALSFEGREFVLADMSPFEIDWEKTQTPKEAPLPEGIRDADFQMEAFDKEARKILKDNTAVLKLEPEPRFSTDQINDLEQKLGAGLLEEVIQVADGENKLVDVMVENKVWEELCERPPHGQWSYFQRNTHVPETQQP